MLATVAPMDTCDRCPETAKVRVQTPGGLPLDFCLPDYLKNQQALLDQGCVIVQLAQQGEEVAVV